tara:strand:- start:82 stop:462 length:381 start_codon:yes stop_codon:yes gene_type:complete
MADYAKLEVKGVYSKVSDYSTPKTKFKPAAYALTPDEYMHFEVNCDDNGETFDLSMFSGGITMLVVKNNDTGINVKATINTANDTGVDVVIPPGGFFVTPDVAIAGDLVLTSASGVPECEVFIVGT